MGGSNSNAVVTTKQLEKLLFDKNSTQSGGSKNITSESHLEYQSIDVSSEFRKLGNEIHDFSVSEKNEMVGGFVDSSSSTISKSSSNLTSSSSSISSSFNSSLDSNLISTSFIVMPEEVLARENISQQSSSSSLSSSDNNKQNFINSSEPILLRANRKSKNSKKSKKSTKSKKSKNSKKSKKSKKSKNKRMYITEKNSENGLTTSSSAVNYRTYSETSNMDIKPFSSTNSDFFSLSKIDRRRS